MAAETENKLFTEYTRQSSTLFQLNGDFPKIHNRSFIDILSKCNQNSGSALELGGGKDQVAAIEILSKFPNLNFEAVEVRLLSFGAQSTLANFPQYCHHQAGFSRLTEIFPQNHFSLIFGHNVMEFLPEPLTVITRLYSLLKPNGVLLVNRLLLYNDWWEKIHQYLINSNRIFASSRSTGQRSLLKAGLYYYALALEKQTKPLAFPGRAKETAVKDYEGTALVLRELEF